MLYSDNSVQNPAEVANDLSKCSIKEGDKSIMDRNSGIPMSRLPLQVPQGIQGRIYFFDGCGVDGYAHGSKYSFTRKFFTALTCNLVWSETDKCIC